MIYRREAQSVCACLRCVDRVGVGSMNRGRRPIPAEVDLVWWARVQRDSPRTRGSVMPMKTDGGGLHETPSRGA
jgi:hypothetical protein